MKLHVKRTLGAASKVVSKTTDFAESKIDQYQINQKIRRRKIARLAGIRTAQKLGLVPVKNMEEEFKHVLADRIIQTVRRCRLTHQQVSWIVKASRPKITRLMNKNLKQVSLEFLLRLSAALGIQPKILFNN